MSPHFALLLQVDPVITVSVTPGERGCVVRLLACRVTSLNRPPSTALSLY